jgi:hypothetical protein
MLRHVRYLCGRKGLILGPYVRYKCGRIGIFQSIGPIFRADDNARSVDMYDIFADENRSISNKFQLSPPSANDDGGAVEN